jgi:hypothetical protein
MNHPLHWDSSPNFNGKPQARCTWACSLMLVTVPAAWELQSVPRPVILSYVANGLETEVCMCFGGCLILAGGVEMINVISQTP